jgi:hypothetical protein
MPVDVAEMILSTAGLYFAVGLVFALVFLALGLRRVDALAADGPWGFKALIFPGVVGLWPIVLLLWLNALFTGSRS